MEKGDVKKASSLLMCTVFVGFLLFFAVGFFAVPFQGINYTEQRTYAKMPEVTAGSLLDGSFGTKLDDYLRDHLILRPYLVTLSSVMRNITGHRSTDMYCRGSDGQLFRRSVYYEDLLKASAGAINRLAEKSDVPVDMLLVPDAAGVLADKLPAGVVNDSEDMIAEELQKQLNSKINLYYAGDDIKKAAAEGMKVYFRTDQHWTTECARSVFESYMRQSGQQLREVVYEEHYSPEFYGNLYPSSPGFFDEPETMLYYTNPSGEYTVTRLDTGETTNSIIDYSYLMKVNSKYSMPLGGEFWRVKITSNAPGGKLLLIGDSYLLPLVQLLADHYSEILIIDARDFENHGMTMEEATGDFSPDRILLVDTVLQVSCGAIRQIS